VILLSILFSYPRLDFFYGHIVVPPCVLRVFVSTVLVPDIAIILPIYAFSISSSQIKVRFITTVSIVIFVSNYAEICYCRTSARCFKSNESYQHCQCRIANSHIHNPTIESGTPHRLSILWVVTNKDEGAYQVFIEHHPADDYAGLWTLWSKLVKSSLYQKKKVVELQI